MFKLAEKTLKTDIKQSSKDVAVGLALGGLAGAISTSVVQPLDQIQNMMSTYKVRPEYGSRTKTYVDLIKAIYRDDLGQTLKSTEQYTKGLKGLKNFYNGLGVKVVKTVPQSALLLGLNAMLYKIYKDKVRENGKV